MAYWLVKTEPEEFSIDDLERTGQTRWDCVRNYEARNNLSSMKKGDEVIVYHSNSDPSGAAGTAVVARTAYPDPTQFDRRSEYFDAKATTDKPRWVSPDLAFREKFGRIVEIGEMRRTEALKAMALLRRGSRLSVVPLSAAEFRAIRRMGAM